MSKLLVAAFGVALLVFVGTGCQHDKDTKNADVTVRTERTDTMQGQDDCPMCEGIQHARPDGTCPQCGMKVKPATVAK